jgi:hypothetical protein
MLHGHLDYFQKPPLGVGLTHKPGDHATPNPRNHWFSLVYHVRGPAWIEIHWNSIWLRTRSHVTSHDTWGSVTTLHDVGGVSGPPFGHFLLGSHNFMVTALGSWLVTHGFISSVYFYKRLYYAPTWAPLKLFWPLVEPAPNEGPGNTVPNAFLAWHVSLFGFSSHTT